MSSVLTDAQISPHDESTEVTDSSSSSSVSINTTTPVAVLTKSQKKRMKKKSKVQSVAALGGGPSEFLPATQDQPDLSPMDGASDINSDWYTTVVDNLKNIVGVTHASFALELDQHFEPHRHVPVIHIKCSAPHCKGHYTLPLPPCVVGSGSVGPYPAKKVSKDTKHRVARDYVWRAHRV